MTPDRRKLTVTVEIMRVLADCEGHLVPQDALLNQCRLIIRPVLLESEFDECLKALEAAGNVVGIRPELGGPVKWKLTDKGRAVFAAET
jgi:hypothetical protein